jgi:HAMP domain-containing protein
MTRLEEALERLERAVARLEAAAQRVAAGEAENRRLREAAGEIAARVDAALDRVGRVLEDEA